MGKAGSRRSAASSALMPRMRWEKGTVGEERPGRSQREVSGQDFQATSLMHPSSPDSSRPPS